VNDGLRRIHKFVAYCKVLSQNLLENTERNSKNFGQNSRPSDLERSSERQKYEASDSANHLTADMKNEVLMN
jgi:hypothetical protein